MTLDGAGTRRSSDAQAGKARDKDKAPAVVDTFAAGDDRSMSDPIAALALSHEVPESLSHAGKHYITLPIEPALFRADASPDIDYALRFNGSTSGVKLDDIPPLGVIRRYTFACWMRPTAHQSGSIFIANRDAFVESNSKSFALRLTSERSSTSLAAYYSASTLLPLGSVIPDAWSHVAFVYDYDEGNCVLYVDGRPNQRQAVPLGEIELADMWVGTDKGWPKSEDPKRAARPANHFRGDLDSITLWDEALTAEQIASIADDRPVSDLPVPVFRFPFDDGPLSGGAGASGQRLASRGRFPDVGAEIVDASWVFSSRPFRARTELDAEGVAAAIDAASTQYVYDPQVFVNPGFLTTPDAKQAAAVALGRLDDASTTTAVVRGGRLRFIRSTTGELDVDIQLPVGEPRPELSLTETYLLSTFRGAYGPGRIVNTFSLLPGEETEISISSYSTRESSTERTSSVLDSSSKTAAETFGKEMSEERSLAESSSEHTDWSAEIEGSVSGPVWSASASAGASGGTESAREALANTVSSVATRQTVEASSSRDVEVNTATTATVTSGEENETVRTIRNINVGRTLNFVFRQMNQELISLLHLTNVEVSFRVAGVPGSGRTVPLAQLDQLLNDVITASARDQVRQMILDEIAAIRDYEDVTHPEFVKHVPQRNGQAAYTRVDRRAMSQYFNPTSGTSIRARGIIIDVMSNVMRTDHVYVDTFIGEGEALDAYSKGLQDEALEREGLRNRLLAEQARADADARQHRRQAVEMIANGNADGVRMLRALTRTTAQDEPDGDD